MNYFITGGAGFIGSHFVDRLLADGHTVTIYDNFTSGRAEHYKHHLLNAKLHVIPGYVEHIEQLTRAMLRQDVVIHLASNPDIAKAATDPTVDFYQGTQLTQNVLEAMRTSGVKKLLYASGSGVYGDRGDMKLFEGDGWQFPISTYGASKLAGETMIAAYCAMFGIQAIAFRFANVVGPRQTHGVAYDFIHRLRQNPNQLKVMGNGHQSKPYIHVTDVVEAVLTAEKKAVHPFDVFNVALNDAISVREIANFVISIMRLSDTTIQYEDCNKGWAGDIPVVRLHSLKIRMLGWKPRYIASGEAMSVAIRELVKEIQ